MIEDKILFIAGPLAVFCLVVVLVLFAQNCQIDALESKLETCEVRSNCQEICGGRVKSTSYSSCECKD